MEPLACLDHFDFDDTTFPPAHSVDGMHPKPAIANQPRHSQLSHWTLPQAHIAGRLGFAAVLLATRLIPIRLVPGARARVTILGRRRDRLVTVALSHTSAAHCSARERLP